jgi:hypothetical protein
MSGTTPTMLSVTIGRKTAGFILKRRHQFEGFDANENSLGLFATAPAAANAIAAAETNSLKQGTRADAPSSADQTNE